MTEENYYDSYLPGVLELFAGSRSIGKAAIQLSFELFSSDINDFEDIDYVVDIRKFDVNKVPFKPFIIWASPPCTGFSVASIGSHWTGGKKGYIPKTEISTIGIELVQKTIEIIKYFNPKYWFIENPRGLLRKMPFMQEFKRQTVWYCQYGDNRAKPTDIWTNSNTWIPRPCCFNGNKKCHHESAPRGAKTGTQGRNGAYDRSKIPHELCIEILQSCI